MAAEELIDSIKQGYELWASKDESAVPYFLSLMADDVKWKSLADGCDGARFSHERTGTADVVKYFTELVEEWELVRFSADEFVCQNDRIVMIGNCSFKHRRTGVVVETPKVDTFRHNGSEITEFMEYYDSHKIVCASKGA